jgi:phosphatidylglycerophosphate synthase
MVEETFSMAMKNPPYDQRIARVLVRPLVNTPVTPNHVTALTLIIALAGAGMMASGDPVLVSWGAGLFVLARFLDHFDGELARQKKLQSRFGYYFDYVSGATSYGALFFCIGVGLNQGPLGSWALVLGTAGAVSAILSMFLNLDIDKIQGGDESGDAVGYPGIAGFELEDGIYLLAPITWAGYLMEFFVAAGIGATVYTIWTFWTLLVLKREQPAE